MATYPVASGSRVAPGVEGAGNREGGYFFLSARSRAGCALLQRLEIAVTSKNAPSSSNGVPNSSPNEESSPSGQAALLFQRAEEDEVADLEREAAAQPDDPALDLRMAEAVRARLDRAAASRSPTAKEPPPGPVRRPSASSSSASRTAAGSPNKRRRRLVGAAVASLFAAAAVLCVLFLWPDDSALPMYALEMKGDDRVLGSVATPEPIRVSMSSSLDITLRPATAAEHPPRVQAYVLRDDRLQPLHAPFSAYPQGTMRLRERVSELPPLAAGRWELVLVLGSRRSLPSADELHAILRAQSPAPKIVTPMGAQILRSSLEVLAQ